MHVAVLGASPKRDRYSNRAVRELLRHGHAVSPVNPAYPQVEGLRSVATLTELPRPVDTLTVYVGPALSGPLIPEIVALRPARVILNPGAESAPLAAALAQAGIPCLAACTLVMLSNKQF